LQGSRANQFTEYTSFDGSYNIITSDVTPNNNSSILLTNAVAVAQHDPLNGLGILTVMNKGSEYGLEYKIWDRTYDNKLYAQFIEPLGTCEIQKACICTNQHSFSTQNKKTIVWLHKKY
jgi:hypothetical protein